MEEQDRRYLVQQNKISDSSKPPVFARVMRSKEGVFEGVSFIKNRDKATVMTMAEANEAIAWASRKKSAASEYVSRIISIDQ